MNPQGYLLVATDFSPQARHATERAARLAHETAVRLALLHVLPGEALASLRQWLGVDSAPQAQLLDAARQQLQQAAAGLRAARHVQAACELATGAPVEQILRQADRLEAHLLVLGARGSGVLRRLVLGTTAERLLRCTTRPLLVVRQAPHEPYRRALVAVDFSPWSGQALALARRIAPHAQLVLFHAFEVPFGEKLHFAGVDLATIEAYRQQARQAALQRVHRLAVLAGLKPTQWQPCVVEGDASLRLVEKEQELDCDLLVLGKHGQSATVDLLLGSVTRHVLAEGSADVAVSTAREG